MSMIQALDDERLKREALARAGSKSPPYGSAERDFADNGWPQETVLAMLKDGLKSGKSAQGWSGAQTDQGAVLWAMELPVASGFCRALLDPATGQVGVMSAGMSFVCDSAQNASELIARATHQAGASARMTDSVSARAGMWQERASAAVVGMSAPQAGLRAKAGEDAGEAWQRDFETIDQRCESAPNSVEAMDRAKANYMGSTEARMAEWIKAEIKAGPNASVAGQAARLVAFGGRGGELRAAIPLKADGSVDGELPIMAALGEPSDGGFKMATTAKQAMRFYNVEAFSKFASSAQSVELSVYPAPELSLNLAGHRLAARLARQPVSTPSAPSSHGPS